MWLGEAQDIKGAILSDVYTGGKWDDLEYRMGKFCTVEQVLKLRTHRVNGTDSSPQGRLVKDGNVGRRVFSSEYDLSLDAKLHTSIDICLGDLGTSGAQEDSGVIFSLKKARNQGVFKDTQR